MINAKMSDSKVERKEQMVKDKMREEDPEYMRDEQENS